MFEYLVQWNGSYGGDEKAERRAGEKALVDIHNNLTELVWLIDTGCSLNLISKDVFEKIPEERRLERMEVEDDNG